MPPSPEDIEQHNNDEAVHIMRDPELRAALYDDADLNQEECDAVEKWVQRLNKIARGE